MKLDIRKVIYKIIEKIKDFKTGLQNYIKTFNNKEELEYEFLPSALEIIESPPSPLGRLTILGILGMVILTIIWSIVGKVDKVAIARGKVVPNGKLKVIQPIEKGIITAIYVEEGERIKKGQLLVELDSTIKKADLNEMRKSLEIAKLEKAIYISELKGEDLKKILEEEKVKLKNVPKNIQYYQKEYKESREVEYSEKQKELKLRINQIQAELQSAKSEKLSLENKYELLQEEESATQKLYKAGKLSKLDWKSKKLELSSTKNSFESQKYKIEQIRNKLEETKKKLSNLAKTRKKELLNHIVDLDKKINSIDSNYLKAKKRFDQQKLTSPVNGTIHGLSTHTIGGVVSPDKPIVTIVPADTPLIVEAQILNKDIGFIKKGYEAEIKFDTFPFQKYGVKKGEVIAISPDAFEDKNKGLVYKMKTTIEGKEFNINDKKIRISPGMAVTVEVKTGKRRIIEFFLSPIIKYSEESLELR